MWQPEETSLKGLAELLNESQVPDNEKQKEVHKKINELSKQPEFCNYLVYILSATGDQSINTLRKIAGATLKGALERNWDKIPPEHLNYVKLKLMDAFTDPTPGIRGAVANSMTALFLKLGFTNWPDLFKYLAHNLLQDDIALVESTLECIAKILEDMEMDSENINCFEEKSNSPLGELIVKLISMCDPRLPWNIRALALRSLNLFTSLMPPSFIANMNSYFEALVICAVDQQPLVRQRSCEGFVGILERRKDLITANLVKILEIMLNFTVDHNIEVKKKACLFWNEYLLVEEDEPMDRIEALHKCLDILLPALVDCLPYTEDDLLALDSVASEAQKNKTYFPVADDDLEEGIHEVHDLSDNANIGEYTLRKEAGNAIEAISRRFEGDAFFKCQAKLEECLKSDNWLKIESGILCLGALSKGAFEIIAEHFQTLFPFLMNSLSNSEALVRCIACWTLSRFTKWIVKQANIDENVVKAYLTEALKLMMDQNDKVQEAACTALSRISYDGTNIVEHFIGDVIQVIKFASEKYQKHTTRYLYDAIGSIAYNLQAEVFQNPNVQDVLLEIIKKKWNESQFNDTEATCLVECTESVISAAGNHAVSQAEFFIPRISFLIFNYIEATKADDKKYLFHKREVAIRCFDFLDTYLGILGPQTEQLLRPADYQNLFQQCVQDEDIGFKQIVLSSCKQVARSCPNLLKDYLQPLAQILLANLYYAPKEIDTQGLYMGCCNNAASALGDVALAFPGDFQNSVEPFAQKICDIFKSQVKLHKGVAQTLSMCLGKLGLVNPDAIAPLLGQFLKPFCMSIGALQDDPEKAQAFRGLFAMILKNPNGIVKDFYFLCYCLADFKDVPADIHELATKIMQEFKSFAGDNWNVYFGKFPIQIRESMTEKYGV